MVIGKVEKMLEDGVVPFEQVLRRLDLLVAICHVAQKEMAINRREKG